MFFARIARIVAFLVFLGSLLRAALAVAVASEMVGPYKTAMARYFPSSANSGDVIESSLLALAFAVALGTLAEIALALRNRT